MAKQRGSGDGLSEQFQELLANVARTVLGLGALATLIGMGFLIYTCYAVAGDATLTAQAVKNVEVFRQVLLYGTIGVAVGASYLFWGEEKNSIALLAFAALLFFAPAWVPLITSAGTNEASGKAMEALQHGGALLGVVALVVLVIDVAGKTRTRAKVGVKADQLRFGKGVKEEKDRQNVFLGKCWQLPYCRKYVRERCPIFHAKRTCWRERVGCMCEEEVIRGAMENKPIPKDRLLDGSAIPRNHRLTPGQKAERCRNCVIYNEHQRHKYKAVIPAVLAGFVLVYAGLHGPLSAIMESFVKAVDRAMHRAIMVNGQAQIPGIFIEGLLFFTMLLALTYSLKLVEYLVFTKKI